MIEPEFLNLEDVPAIHKEQLEAYGGIHGIRDKGLLESAVMMPQASFGGVYLHQDLFEISNGNGSCFSHCGKSTVS